MSTIHGNMCIVEQERVNNLINCTPTQQTSSDFLGNNNSILEFRCVAQNVSHTVNQSCHTTLLMEEVNTLICIPTFIVGWREVSTDWESPQESQEWKQGFCMSKAVDKTANITTKT